MNKTMAGYFAMRANALAEALGEIKGDDDTIQIIANVVLFLGEIAEYFTKIKTGEKL